MKLFIVAALISAVAAARLEHLERGYLPPPQNNYAVNSRNGNFPSGGAPGNFGVSSSGSQYNAQSRSPNGIGGFGPSNDFVSVNGRSHGFGNNGARRNGFGASPSQQSNGFETETSNGANSISGSVRGSSAATSNQYLPPNFGAQGSQARCSTCGSFGSPQQGNFRSQGLSIPSTQYGSPQSLIPSSKFASQRDEPFPVNRQYLAPKNFGTQQGPQQAFDENTGYIY